MMDRFVAGVFVALLVVASAAARGDEVRFQVRVINAESQFPSCAVFDVNRDGKLDLVSGGFWYEGPRWKQHFLREVEQIRGRYDDYSNLPLDVNGDGWIDVVSVNYRSKSLYWVENPGEVLRTAPETPWKRRVIDTPGPMETGRLHDLNGDGKLDILPNCVGFAAWYELDQSTPGKPAFIKHDLPAEISGHGIGLGDLNGDGRADLIGPRGWLAAPENQTAGKWLWNPDFQLFRDASVPILVHDVDRDGDADLVYSRAHRHGIYWLERVGERWEQHAIDTSWSSSHSLLLVDIDGDGKEELITGKRYLAHDGKDPGEYDPLCAYAYAFQPQTKTWRRTTIHENPAIGFGLDPKAADLDGDGDSDLLYADRKGFYLLENIGKQPPAEPSPLPYYSHQRPLLLAKEAGLFPINEVEEWTLRRQQILRGMEQAMGQLPDSTRRVPLDVKLTAQEEQPDHVRLRFTFASEAGDRTPALLLVPKSVTLAKSTADKPLVGAPGALGGAAPQRLPAMLCLHQTNADGKDQSAGLGGRASMHYGLELVRRGYVCLLPDYPSFGEYKSYDFAQKRPGTEQPLYASGTMKAIWTNIRAVDLLQTLPYVDPDRIGAIGHSLGGHNALYTAAFEQRLRCVVTSCGFTGFHDYYQGNLKGWTSDRYMPRIRDVYENNPDKMPFDFHEVLAAIAPRGLFVNAPLHDANFDNAGVRKVIAAVEPVYALQNAQAQLVTCYPDCEHDFPDAIRTEVYEWLERQLK